MLLAKLGPVRMSRLAVLVLAAAAMAWPSGGAAATEDPNPPMASEAVRDGTGRVWGIVRNHVPSLYVSDGSESWQPAEPVKLGGNGWLCTLGRRADGTVVCLWRLDGKHCVLSTHRGRDSQAGQPFDLPKASNGDDFRLTPDSKNNLWITQNGPGIYRLKPDGSIECAHTVSADECLAGGRTTVWNMVSVSEDAGGRVWFWSSLADGGNGRNAGTIRGALAYDGDHFVRHDFLLPDGKAPGPLTLLTPKDPQHLWLARKTDGLYTLDTTTFQAERVADQPEEGTFTSLAVHVDGAAWYFVMGQVRPEGGGTLWRWQDQHWTKLIDPVDAEYSFNHQQDRVWSVVGNGAFLGTNGNGLWFLPSSGSDPVHVDWRQRFPLASPRAFLDLENGRWLGVSATGQTWVGVPAELTAGRSVPDDPRVRTLRVGQRLYADGRGHLWSAFTYNSPVLHEWDGERWSEHRFPAELGAHPALRVLNTDVRDRVWLRADSHPKRVVLYDPPTDRWQVFDGLEPAAEAQDGHVDAQFRTVVDRYDLPRYGPPGCICYLADQRKVRVFNNGAWRLWMDKEIVGSNEVFGFDGPPFFNRAGRVSINSEHQTWELREGEGWKAVAYEQGFADDDVRNPPPPTESRLGFHPASAVRDNEGSWWLTWQRGLYRFRDDLCVPVLKAGDPQPFGDGRWLAEAAVDARGNLFLRNGDTEEEYVILAPSGPPPHTTLAEAAGNPAQGRGERRVIRLTTDAGPVDGKVRFGWRLDGGGWNAVGADGPRAAVTLEDLPGGAHRFEARSFDSALQTDAKPAGLDFQVDLDPQAQVAGYIAQLAAPDDDRRKTAVAALALQPERARAALEAARTRTNDADERWWIDAALQQIETNRRAEAR